MESKVKLIEERAEPVFDIVENSTREIPMLLSVISDNCSYECNIQEIEFPDTFSLEVYLYLAHFIIISFNLL